MRNPEFFFRLARTRRPILELFEANIIFVKQIHKLIREDKACKSPTFTITVVPHSKRRIVAHILLFRLFNSPNPRFGKVVIKSICILFCSRQRINRQHLFSIFFRFRPVIHYLIDLRQNTLYNRLVKHVRIAGTTNKALQHRFGSRQVWQDLLIGFFQRSTRFTLCTVYSRFRINRNSRHVLCDSISLLIQAGQIEIGPSAQSQSLPFDILLIHIFAFRIIDISDYGIQVIDQPVMEGPQLICTEYISLSFSPIIIVI